MRSPLKRRLTGVALAAVLLCGGIGAGLALSSNTSEEPISVDAPASNEQADSEAVVRGDLVETKDAVGTVGHGDPWTAAAEPQGVVTRRHDEGTVVRPGETLIWVDNQPVVLAEGDTPMYRTLELKRDAARKLIEGDDVRQLQAFLIAGGFDDAGRLEADGVFGEGTRRAVKAWQKENGWEQSGKIDRTQMAFYPTALRIDSAPQVGSMFVELSVTNASQEITAGFDTKSSAFLAVGGVVSLDVGDSTTSEGTITDVTSTVADDGTRRLTVTVEPSELLSAGVERVTVTATRQVATAALLVPVRAILALAGGGYAVEIEGAGAPTLTRIELGAIVDDLAEITGDISEGDTVVVPTDVIGGATS